MNNSPISDRMCALIADGVQQFPHAKDIALCKRCVRAEKRRRVIVAQEISPKKFFVLAEFPDADDESGTAVFAKNSNTGVILNLLEKLGIDDQSHHSFALKCFSKNLVPDDHLPICVMENLFHEIQMVKPNVLLCFGARAFHALSKFIMPAESLKLGNKHTFEYTSGSLDVYPLPSAQELNQYPNWRLSVWSKLVHFKEKKNIAS